MLTLRYGNITLNKKRIHEIQRKYSRQRVKWLTGAEQHHYYSNGSVCELVELSNWTETIPKTNPMKLRTKPETYKTTDRGVMSNGHGHHEMYQDFCMMFTTSDRSCISSLPDPVLYIVIIHCLHWLTWRILWRRNHVVPEELKYLAMNVPHTRHTPHPKNIRSPCTNRKFVKMGTHFPAAAWSADVELPASNQMSFCKAFLGNGI